MDGQSAKRTKELEQEYKRYFERRKALEAYEKAKMANTVDALRETLRKYFEAYYRARFFQENQPPKQRITV